MGNSTKAKHHSFSKHTDGNLLKHQSMMNDDIDLKYKQLMETLLKLENKMTSQEFLESNIEVIQNILSSFLERVRDWHDVGGNCGFIKQKIKDLYANVSEYIMEQQLKEANAKLDQLMLQ